MVAPTPHCQFFDTEEETIVGERDVGDARLDYEALINRWFDFWLKGEDNGFTKDTPKVQYYTMGRGEWQTADSWPPAGARPVAYYLHSGGAANSLFGDGRLSTKKPGRESKPDRFTYDPAVPVRSLGGGLVFITGYWVSVG